MINYRIIIPLLIFALLSSSAYSELLVTIDNDNQRIFPGDVSEFVVKIKNMGSEEDTARLLIVASASDWDFTTDPTYNLYTLGPGDEKEVKVYVNARDFRDIAFKQYNFPFRVESSLTGEVHNKELSLFVRDPNLYYGYRPSLNVVAQLDNNIDPRQSATLLLMYDNRNPLNISRMEIRVSSELDSQIDMIKTIMIPPLGKASETFDIRYDPLQKPSRDTITIEAYIPGINWTMDTIVREIDVVSYSEIVSETRKNESFLKTIESRTYHNNGNVYAIESIKVETSIFRQLFVTTVPKADTLKEAGKRYLSWELSVGPDYTKEILIITNYRPLFIIIILSVVALVLYYLLRSPIILRKDAHVIRAHEDETDVSRVKVLIHVKNRTGKIIDNLSLIDRIPPIAELEDKYAMGTMQPTKVIRNEKRGTMVKWQIPTIEPFEERIVTYNLKSKLRIVGGLSHKPAVVKFKGRFGQSSKVSSNRVLSR